jgi:hypothetical protein
MFKWILNKFRKADQGVIEPETETHEVGELDLIFCFKDGSSDIRHFVGEVFISSKWEADYDWDEYKVETALSKAIDFLDLITKFGWYLQKDNRLLPVSAVEEIFVVKREHSVTVDKL